MKKILNATLTSLHLGLSLKRSSLPAIAIAIAMVWSAAAWAAPTDIATAPVASTGGAVVKPNVMLLMDASSSLKSTHMPDEVRDVIGLTSAGYKSADCNVLYYNRNQKYSLPKRPDSTLFPAPSFTSAPFNGYGSPFNYLNSTANPVETTTVNLSTSFVPYQNETLQANVATSEIATPQAAYYYYYTGPQAPLNYKSAPCADADDLTGNATKPATGGGTWHRVVVSSTSGPLATDERQNFANWYSFYRTRLNLTKSSSSLAFATLSNGYRVGFITVEPKTNPTDSTINPDRFLAVNDFGGTHRNDWFNKLFAQTPSGAAPAREGLARVGRYYAGKSDGINAGMVPDPVQYSCQQNFTIMTTDGYWNNGTESPGGGGVQLDGVTLVGQQDGTLTAATGLSPRPIWDGNVSSLVTVKDASNAYRYLPCVGPAVPQKYTAQTTASTYQLTETRDQTSVTTTQPTFTRNQMLKNETQYAYTTKQDLATIENYTLTTTRTDRNESQLFAESQQLIKTTDQYTDYRDRVETRIVNYTVTQDQTLRSQTQFVKTQTQLQRDTFRYSLSTINSTLSISEFKKRRLQYNIVTADNDLIPVSFCAVGPACIVRDPDLPGRAAPSWVAVTSCVPSGPPTGPLYDITECGGAGVIQTDAPVPLGSCTAGPPSLNAADGRTYECKQIAVGGSTNYVSDCGAYPVGLSTQTSSPYTQSECIKNPVLLNEPVSTCTPTIPPTGIPFYECKTVPVGSPVIDGTCTAPGSTTVAGVTTTCSYSINTSNVPVDPSDPECLPANASPSAANQYKTTSCTSVAVGSPNSPIANCTPGVTYNSSTGIRSNCVQTVGAWVNNPGPTCTPVTLSNATLDNVECQTSFISNLPVNYGICAANSVSYDNTTGTRSVCTRNVTSNPYDWTIPGFCVPEAWTASASRTETTCTSVDTPPAPVLTCPPNTGASSWVRWTCPTTGSYTNPTQVGVPSCIPNLNPALGPIVTCTPVITTVPVPGCSNPGVPIINVGPPYTVTQCDYTTSTVGVPENSCVNNVLSSAPYTRTTCSNAPNGVEAAPVCTNGMREAPTAQWVYKTCQVSNPVVNQPVPSASCTGSTNVTTPSYLSVTTCTAQPPEIRYGASCSASPYSVPADSSNAYEDTCTVATTTEYLPSASDAKCVNASPSFPSYITKSCTYNNLGGPQFVAACTTQNGLPGAETTGDLDNDGNGVNDPGEFINKTCAASTPTAPVDVASCNGGPSGNPITITVCGNRPLTGPIPDQNCQQGTDSNGVITTCVTGTLPGQTIVFDSTITSTVQGYSGTVPVGPPVAGPTTTLLNQPANGGVCYTAAVPSLPANGQPAPSDPPLASVYGNPSCSVWPCSVTTTSDPGGSENSLADVAQYYYATPLRGLNSAAWPSSYVTAGSPPTLPITTTVPGAVPRSVTGGPEEDRVDWQHMTTFTLALGVSGTLKYVSDYKTAASGDFADIRTGVKGWPVWPDPTLAGYPNFTPSQWQDLRSIDDYWHTAVNGRGQFFSANKPNEVVDGLSTALSSIADRDSAGASFGISSATPKAGDNYAFTTTYETGKWTGEVEARTIDTNSGLINPAVLWSADTLLTARAKDACDTREIFLMRSSATNGLVNFTWDSRQCDLSGNPTGAAVTDLNLAEQANFNLPNAVSQFSHYLSMTDGTSSTVNQITPAVGANLVNFIRGQRKNEGFKPNDADKLYRSRAARLGDVVGAQPVYVKAPFSNYADPAYQAFKTANANRRAMVYVGANDGMLHAFDAITGQESWAIIPSAMLPNLYKLADNDYKNRHQYYVDATPTVADALIGGTWRTLLIGGYNAGGRGYYALDVTNPDTPLGLWEFKSGTTCYSGTPQNSDCELGLSFGRPLISKLTNGDWVVIVTSGYNNTGPGSGGGFLYVLNAADGTIQSRHATGVGSTATPSGLAQVANFVDDPLAGNVTQHVYGGDVLGNLWRFNVNVTGSAAVLLGTANDSAGNPQPITVRPELAEVAGKPMVLFGTGRLLGTSDLNDTQQQSIYGVVDANGGLINANLRSALNPIALTTLTGPPGVRGSACAIASCTSTSGWVADLPDSGERVNVDPELVLGTLIVASNVPSANSCVPDGYGWFNYFDFKTGLKVITSTNNSVSSRVNSGLIAGVTTYQTQDGKLKSGVTTTAPGIEVLPPPFAPGTPLGNRISWREIVDE